MERLFDTERYRFHSIEGGRDLGIYQPYTNQYIKDELINSLKTKLEEDDLEEDERLYNDNEINCAKQFMGTNETSFVLIRYYSYTNSYVYFMSHNIGKTQYDFVVCFNIYIWRHEIMNPISVHIVDKITHVKSARGGVRK